MTRLTQADVEQLKNDPSPAGRARTLLRVAQVYGSDRMSASEHRIALAIIGAVLPVAEVEIRRRVAECVARAPWLDGGLARLIAMDVIQVAEPVLLDCMTLSEQDLTEIVTRCPPEHARVLAMRRSLPGRVAELLVRRRDETVTLRIAANDNIDLSAAALHEILDQLGHNPQIVEQISLRSLLPLAIVERLASIVSGRILETLITKYNLPPQRISNLLDHGREQFLLSSLVGSTAEELRDMATRLKENDLLTATLVTRALAIGQFGFLLQAVAVRSDMPVGNIRRLLSDDGGRGQAELFDHCGFARRYRALFCELAFAARNYPAQRDGRAPAGWADDAIPILNRHLAEDDPDWALEQLVTEALLHLNDKRSGSEARQTLVA